MKAFFLSKCQPKGENVLFCESVLLLHWYPSILSTPLARYYKDVRILLQIYLFIYLFTTWHFFTWNGNLRKKTSPRLKPLFIYLFIYVFILFYLFILFFLMYKRVIKCIMVGANVKDRSDLFACSGSLRSWRFVWREGKWTVQISEAVSASCSSLFRFSFARSRNKTTSYAGYCSGCRWIHDFICPL